MGGWGDWGEVRTDKEGQSETEGDRERERKTISEGQRVDRKKEEAHRLEVDLRRNKSLLVLCLGCQSKVKGL